MATNKANKAALKMVPQNVAADTSLALSAEAMALATETANGYIKSNVIWPTTFQKIVGLTIAGKMSDKNANNSPAGAIDDDVSRFVEAMAKIVADSPEDGVVKITEKTATSRKSGLRLAVALGKLHSKGINGPSLLADTVIERAKHGDKAKPLYECYCSVAREQIKIGADKKLVHDTAIVVADNAKLVRKADKSDPTAASEFETCVKRLQKIYVEKTDTPDNFAGSEARSELIGLLDEAAKMLRKYEDEAKREAAELEAEENAAANVEERAAKLARIAASFTPKVIDATKG